MIRDTETGNALPRARPGDARHRASSRRRSPRRALFGLAGAFYDDSLDYPLPLLGVQHFNFDLWGKGKQLSVFFGGALSYGQLHGPVAPRQPLRPRSRPLRGGLPVRRRRATATARRSRTRRSSTCRPSSRSTSGSPLGPYLKASLGLFTKWDNFQRDKDTGPDFVTPVDTFTDGAELRLVVNHNGFQRGQRAATSRGRTGSPGEIPRPRSSTRTRRTTGSTRSISEGPSTSPASASSTSG